MSPGEVPAAATPGDGTAAPGPGLAHHQESHRGQLVPGEIR